MSTELRAKIDPCRIIGRRGPRASSRSAARRIRRRVRIFRLGRRSPRLRRSSWPALPAPPRGHTGLGALALRSWLVGGLRRTLVLSTGRGVARRRAPFRLARRSRRDESVRGSPLDCVDAARHYHLRALEARARQRLARVAGRLRGADAVVGLAQRRRRGTALGADRGAPRLGRAASRRTLARRLGRGRAPLATRRRTADRHRYPPP